MTATEWDKVKFFRPSEFDSPDEEKSGFKMQKDFIYKLDLARHYAGEIAREQGLTIIFQINSGYRTKQHNLEVGGATNSSHLTGWAADIRVKTNKEREIILNSLIKAGLDKRIGIAKTFIHVDCDPNKGSSFWTYNSIVSESTSNKLLAEDI